MRFDRGGDLLARKLRIAREEFAVAAAQRLAAAVDIVEKQRGLARDLHLCVKAGAFEFFRAREQRVGERAGFIERAEEDGSDDAMEANVERVDEDDSAAREQARQQFAERRAVRFARGIRFVKRAGDILGSGPLQRLCCGPNQCLYGLAERDFADALARVRIESGQIVAREAVARDPGGMIDLG